MDNVNDPVDAAPGATLLGGPHETADVITQAVDYATSKGHGPRLRLTPQVLLPRESKSATYYAIPNGSWTLELKDQVAVERFLSRLQTFISEFAAGEAQ
jgi:hypothetical protein